MCAVLYYHRQAKNKKNIRKHKASPARGPEGQHASFFTRFRTWPVLKARPGYADTIAVAAGLVADGITAERQK